MRTITSGTDDSGKSYVQNGNAKITSDTDDFGRTTKINTKLGNNPKFSVNYTYQNVVDENNQTTYRTTNKVDEMTYKLGEGENAAQIVKYKYSYDSNGNITEVWDGNNKIAKYQYDSLNQIKVAWDYQQNLKFTYTYDNSGNISGATNQALDPRYGEDYTVGSPHSIDYYYNDSSWGDLLTSLNSTSLSYDNIGNPTSYRDGMEMSWSGRELQSITKNSNTYSFTYNLDGLRTRRIKTQGNTILDDVNYYYDDSKNLIGLKKGNTTVLFYYDSEGSLYSMSKGDDTYFFIKDLQGDIRKIIDEEGTVVATYAYDAWGALLAENEDSSIEGLNPFRYRGYVYDNETELYYLQSRYYDPKTGRFINADDSAYTDTYSGSPLSTNMFAYCENNAISGYDPTGNWAITEKNSDGSITKGHPTLTKKFSETVKKWVQIPDKHYKSTDCYSSPFHSRGANHNPKSLQIAEYLYNKAINIRKDIKNGEFFDKNFKFIYKDSNSISSLKPFYLGYVCKDKNSPNYWKKTTKTEGAQNLLDDLNKIKKKKTLADAFIGLALHVLQDHFAHNTRIHVYEGFGFFKIDKGEMSTTTFSTNYVKSTRLFEDDPNVLSWRFHNAKKITDSIFNKYKSGLSIKSIYAKTVSKEKVLYFLAVKTFKIYEIHYKEYRLLVN